jgi:hypothetical protein
VQVIETRKRVIGPDHPDTLTSMHSLAHALKSQGRVEEAIGLMTRAERLQRERLGSDHPRTKMSTRALYVWQALQEAREAAETVAVGFGAQRWYEAELA